MRSLVPICPEASLGCAASGNESYLLMLGERVKTLRARRGISRKILSESALISERYLAQLEYGRGNISISLLRQIAQAMDVTLEELVREGREQSLEHNLMLQHLESLTATEISKIYSQIIGEDTQASERVNHIALIGLRGAGKSTLGALLAENLSIPLIELVQEIEGEAGMTVNEIFSLSGQAAYRRLERQCLENTLKRKDKLVLTVGGSLVSEAASYERLLSSCYTIWLKADPEQHMARVIGQGDYRPMAGNTQAMDDLRRILAGREGLYERADLCIDTSADSVDDSLQKLLLDTHINNILPNAGEP